MAEKAYKAMGLPNMWERQWYWMLTNGIKWNKKEWSTQGTAKKGTAK